MSRRKDRLDPVHPGDVLREDFMKPLGMSAYAVAKAIGSTPIAISQIIRRKRAVSAEMALKLGRLFNVSPELWMGIQADYDLELARDRSEAEIFRRVHPLKERAERGPAGWHVRFRRRDADGCDRGGRAPLSSAKDSRLPLAPSFRVAKPARQVTFT